MWSNGTFKSPQPPPPPPDQPSQAPQGTQEERAIAKASLKRSGFSDPLTLSIHIHWWGMGLPPNLLSTPGLGFLVQTLSGKEAQISGSPFPHLANNKVDSPLWSRGNAAPLGSPGSRCGPPRPLYNHSAMGEVTVGPQHQDLGSVEAPGGWVRQSLGSFAVLRRPPHSFIPLAKPSPHSRSACCHQLH